MIKNVGTIDKFIRLTLGFILLIVSVIMGVNSTLSVILLILGIVLISTSIVAFCPLYLPFKINTNKTKGDTK
jgi:uncharacterized membrane protein